MQRRVSTMSSQDQKAIQSATGLRVSEAGMAPQPEPVDLQQIQEEGGEAPINVANPVAPQTNPLYDGVGEP